VMGAAYGRKNPGARCGSMEPFISKRLSAARPPSIYAAAPSISGIEAVSLLNSIPEAMWKLHVHDFMAI